MQHHQRVLGAIAALWIGGTSSKVAAYFPAVWWDKPKPEESPDEGSVSVQGFDPHRVTAQYGHGSPGVLQLRSGQRYPITWDDVLWIAKTVWGESMDGNFVHAASVIWTISQRADLFWPSVSASYGGQLGRFFRNFSSPIRESNPTNPRIVAARWDEIPAYAQQMALAYASGALPNPIPGSVDFANRRLPRPGMRLMARIGYRGPTTGNNFYARRSGTSWSDSYDWTRHRVVGAAGASQTTLEALERYGVQAQDSATGLFEGLFPGGDRIIRRLSGQGD